MLRTFYRWFQFIIKQPNKVGIIVIAIGEAKVEKGYLSYPM